ncbi:hypothetical protein GIB67_012097 [Kingdonia uniflora]|uniref:SHSP domain-containing protein n=1 Tax=Kingdonia uniflora TaxID=39325 RepID=A0A7J7LI72_9MAGN|nr:hypothetical protein GIB67_012097 [Kingdonia uniflora]
MPPKKRNIALRYDINASLAEFRQKKLRRLPHIFSRVLELPFHSDADILIEENPDCFRFVVITDDVGDDVRAHIIEIYPGVTKIVIKGSNVLEFAFDGVELDLWRFRLPSSTRPELASAVYVEGELVITVPKGRLEDEEDEHLRGRVGSLVLVQ